MYFLTITKEREKKQRKTAKNHNKNKFLIRICDHLRRFFLYTHKLITDLHLHLYAGCPIDQLNLGLNIIF